MSAVRKILPGTGRGTIRRMVEGYAQDRVTSRRDAIPLVPLHQLRWSPSSCRGGLRAAQPTTPVTSVTLNSFQGPFRLLSRSMVGQEVGAVALSTRTSGRAAQWMLKQVQHDDVVREAAE